MVAGDTDITPRKRDGKVALKLQTLELGTRVLHALETARPLIDARAQSLIVNLPSDPLYVKGNAVRLAQVIGNVLTNAANYTQEGGA